MRFLLLDWLLVVGESAGNGGQTALRPGGSGRLDSKAGEATISRALARSASRRSNTFISADFPGSSGDAGGRPAANRRGPSAASPVQAPGLMPSTNR
jgi:hypothetical protein